MRIDKIVLSNFGSYEGITTFDTQAQDDKNIVLIGGKNGAGKTTLFTAIRLCLYDYRSMGYRNQNSYYHRAITRLINNNAKLLRPVNSYVALHLSLSNGRELDGYVLSRVWTLSDTLSEVFEITKNGISLSDSEVGDFEKYLMSLIPPELFNLYFFDGEKIADFFLNEGSNSRIKDAFLTLCGYDTFDIMRRNFRRISSGAQKSTSSLDEYISAKETVQDLSAQYQQLTAELEDCTDNISGCEADIESLEKEYSQKGGISLEEWNQKLFILKEEDKKRENWNALLKKWANEVIPFLMIRDRIVALRRQIDQENNSAKYRNFREVLSIPEIQALVSKQSAKLLKLAEDHLGGNSLQILDLSLDDSASLLSQVVSILDFEAEKVAKCKRAIKRSISLSAKVRSELENSNVNAVQEYMRQRSELFEKKSCLLAHQIELEQSVAQAKSALVLAEQTLARIQTKLEEELKRTSINDISAKAIVMLDKLQQTLYRQQIAKVEAFFRKDIRILMRKENFIDDIVIDDDFNTHIYRSEAIPTSQLLHMIQTNSDDRVATLLGNAALNRLYHYANGTTTIELITFLSSTDKSEYVLPFEIDKSSLSNGEKQVFIMALYHSLIQLCNHEIPFIIDTPFARIDTEHRKNISRYFFSKLKGQVFILSTNKEIDSEHVQIMKDRILATYLLENSDNKRTTVIGNSYFEV